MEDIFFNEKFLTLIAAVLSLCYIFIRVIKDYDKD